MKNKKLPPKKLQSAKNKLRFEKLIPSSVNDSEVFNAKWLLPMLSLGLLIFLFSIRKIANLDTGFHLAAGKWILNNFSVPVKDIFTYTISQNEYVDIQWLYQVLIYSFYSVFNYYGLTIFNSITLLLIFYVMLKRMNLSGVPVFLSLVLLFVTAVTIQLRFGYRPEIVTWLFIVSLLFILDNYYYFNSGKLFLLPLIMFLWVNMHGLFILGLIIIASYLISIFIDKKSLDKNLLKWFLISVAAVFVNPYFIEGAMFPFYLFTRLQKGNIFRQNITELQPPWGMSGNLGLELNLYYLISILSFVLIIITFRKRAFHQFALLAAFFYLSYSSFRNIPLFIIYAVYIIGICLTDILNSEKVKSFFDKIKRYEHTFKIIFTVILFLICIRIFTNAYYRNYNSEIKFGTGIDETILPEQTTEFVNENSINGKVINPLEFGGWLEWKTRLPVFIDGRLEVMKEDFYKEYLSGFSKNGLKDLTEKYNAEIIINDISNFNRTSQINELKEWRLVHWDQTASVYAKTGFTENVNFDFQAVLTAAGIDTNEFTPELKNKLINSGHIEGLNDWLNGFYTEKIKPIEFMRMGNFAFDNSQYATAEMLYLNFLKKSRGSLDELNYNDVYNNLGSVYYLLNDFQRSIACYEKYLQTKPNDAQIKNRVNELKAKLRSN